MKNVFKNDVSDSFINVSLELDVSFAYDAED